MKLTWLTEYMTFMFLKTISLTLLVTQHLSWKLQTDFQSVFSTFGNSRMVWPEVRSIRSESSCGGTLLHCWWLKPLQTRHYSPRTRHNTRPASCSPWAGSLPSACWFCLVAPCEPGLPSSPQLSGAPTPSPRHLESVIKSCLYSVVACGND